MANVKISQLTPKGANLAATDLLEISEFNGSGYETKSITGQEIIDAASGGGAEWGTITGTLSSQTDLNTALSGKQATLVSGTNIKTINGNSVLGSGDLTISGGLLGNSNLFNYFPSTSFGVDASINAATSANSALSTNGIHLYPFIPNKTITSVSLKINVGAGAAGVNARILFYSDLNGFPNTKIYESANLDCSTTGIKTAITAFTFTAGTTYWIGMHSSGSITVTGIQASALPSLFTTALTAQASVQYVNTSYPLGSAPTTYVYSTQTQGAVPRILISLS